MKEATSGRGDPELKEIPKKPYGILHLHKVLTLLLVGVRQGVLHDLPISTFFDLFTLVI
jgi:hypothetical protein